MKKNIVAIVGRPNVGKSTLFNRICRRRSAIVDFEEGVTRDRKYEEAEWNGHNFIIIDTGGIIPKSEDKINRAVKFQAEIAIEEADVVIFLVDAHTGLTDIDSQVAAILSQHREKVILTVNKADNEKFELDIFDFMKLGFGEPIPIAAISGRNTGNFLDKVVKKFVSVCLEEKIDENEIKVAIVGKPNAGKSSIINRLIGQQKAIVTDIPGTTRDSIDLHMNYFQKKITFIDTAGLRKKSRIKYGIEYFSTIRTIESINRADVVLIIIDAGEEISQQDQKIASYAERNFKEVVIVINKWDLVEKDNSSANTYLQKARDKFRFLRNVPVIFVSALSGQRIQKIFKTILEVDEQSKKRISTNELNKFLKLVISRFPPSHSSGKQTNIYYCTQVRTKPPTFVFFCNNAGLITTHYRRYLHNQLRGHFGFQGSGIKTLFRGKNPK